MLGLEAAVAMITQYGLIIVAPITVLEGPIITVIAAWLASQHIFSLWAVIVVVILANLVGDLGHYALGRWGVHRLPKRWRDRLGLNRSRLTALAEHYHNFGGRTLLAGKMTLVVVGPVLVAAGMARMNIWKFLWVNFLGTIPTSLIFVALGYSFGSAYEEIDGWIGRLSVIGLCAAVVAGIMYLTWKRALK